MEWLLEPLRYPFMVRALIIAALVAVCCAELSCQLIVRGWSLMGDAVSHAVLPGIVIADVLSLPLALGAFAAALFCAVSTGWLHANSRIKSDTVMGIVFAGMFGFGLVLLTRVETDQHVMHVLFGNLLGVSWRDIVETAGLVALILGFTLTRGRDLVLHAFDPTQASAVGMNVTLLRYGLLTALALAIVAAIQAVGVILVVALLIGPGATGYLLASDFGRMRAVAIGGAVVSALGGTLIAFHINASPAACIVLIQAALFTLTLGWVTWRGRRARPADISSEQTSPG
jgi:manganese/iron transport system permease protein